MPWTIKSETRYLTKEQYTSFFRQFRSQQGHGRARVEQRTLGLQSIVTTLYVSHPRDGDYVLTGKMPFKRDAEPDQHFRCTFHLAHTDSEKIKIVDGKITHLVLEVYRESVVAARRDPITF